MNQLIHKKYTMPGKKKAPSKSLRKSTHNTNPVSGIVPLTKAAQKMYDLMNASSNASAKSTSTK